MEEATSQVLKVYHMSNNFLPSFQIRMSATWEEEHTPKKYRSLIDLLSERRVNLFSNRALKKIIAMEVQFKLSLRVQCQKSIGHMAHRTFHGVLLPVYPVWSVFLQKCFKFIYNAPSYIDLAKFLIHVNIYFLFNSCQLNHITT